MTATTMMGRFGAVFTGRRAVWPSARLHVTYSEADFRRVLQRERVMTDRSGRSFSVILLTARDQRPETLARMLPYLDRRLRASDELGWLNAAQLGLLLRDTDAVGAGALVRQLTAELTARECAPACRVSTYPADGPGVCAPATDPRQRDFAELGPDWMPQDHAARVAGDGGRLCAELLAPPMPRWKSVADAAVAFGVLVFLAPLMLLMAMLIKVVSPGPVFFRQDRIGRLGRPFVCWKFRTMQVDADADTHRRHVLALMQSNAPLRKLEQEQDRRLIPLARMIRAAGLDELPQLFNVLRGDMSLIGPRPCLRYEYERFERWHKQRCDTRPGLTGLWQVSGKNRTTFQEMMRLDIAYGRQLTWVRDLAIGFQTLPVIVSEIGRVVQGRLREGVERKWNRGWA